MNNGSEWLDVVVTFNSPFLFLTGPTTFSLEPGGTAVPTVAFNCGTTTSFSAAVQIEATGQTSGQKTSGTIPVTLEIRSP